jgi:hypothetical protein
VLCSLEVGADGVGAGGDLNVLEVDGGVLATAVAGVFPQPGSVSRPVGHGEAHVSEVVSHQVVTAVVAAGGHGLAVLGHGRLELLELAILLNKFNLEAEGLGGVDGVLATGSVLVSALVVEELDGVLDAGASTVAVPVVALVSRGVAGMSGGLVGVLVGLHDVELRAVLASDLVGIAVPPAVSVVKVTVLVLGGHAYHVEGSDAATGDFAHVDVVGDRSSEEVRSVEGLGVVVGSLQEVGAGSLREVDSVVDNSAVPAGVGKVEGLVLSVLLDGHALHGALLGGHLLHPAQILGSGESSEGNSSEEFHVFL